MALGPFIPYAAPGDYGITTELWRTTRTGALVERVDPAAVGQMSITCNENIPAKRQATIQTDAPHTYRPFHDFLMPFLTITDPEGNSVTGPQGLFVVVPSPTSVDASGVTGSVQCQDVSLLLGLGSSLTATIEAGTDRGEYVRRLAFDAGFGVDQVQIPDLGVLQAETKTWDPGATFMEQMTDMMSGSNWYQPWVNNHGRLVSQPYRPLDELAPAWTYTNATDDDAADLEGAISDQPDWNRLANRVTVRKIGNADTPTISYTVDNNNLDSPASIPNLGVIISERYDNIDLVDEAAAKAQAEQLVSESASQYRKVSLPSFPIVDADLHQTVGLETTVDGQVIHSGIWLRTGFSLVLDGAATTFVQELSRVEAWR